MGATITGMSGHASQSKFCLQNMEIKPQVERELHWNTANNLYKTWTLLSSDIFKKTPFLPVCQNQNTT